MKEEGAVGQEKSPALIISRESVRDLFFVRAVMFVTLSRVGGREGLGDGNERWGRLRMNI